MISRTILPRILFRKIAAPLPRRRQQLFFSTTPHQRITPSPPTKSSAPMAAPTDTAAAEVASENNITPESLTATLRSRISATHIDIQDMSGGCGQAFNAVIVSPDFEKKTLLARHRMVNNALKTEIAAIHAWTPRCLTPEQWDKEKKETEGS